MSVETESPKVSQRQKTTTLWRVARLGALVQAALISVVVGFEEFGEGSASEPEPLLAGAAFLAGAASFWWRARHRIESPLSADGSKPRLTDAEAEAFSTNAFTTWKMVDAIVIFGMVAAFFSKDMLRFIPFGAAAFLLFVSHRPTAWPQWEQLDE